MLLEIAIADAYGVGFEYRPQNFIRENNDLEKYYSHEKYASLHGCYSDDTQMSLGIAELMLENASWEARIIADYFVEVFQRDPRNGYSKKFQNILSASSSGEDLLSNIVPTSDRSGAAMRSGIIGLYADTEGVMKKTRLQASLTHNTESGKAAAEAAALLTHYFAYQKGAKADVGNYVSEVVSSPKWSEDWSGEVGEKGWMSVRAAITAIKKSSSQSELLKTCIAFTGDVDTVAAIAFSAAYFCREIERDLPDWMYEHLENGKYGRDYLISVDKRLAAKFEEVINWPQS
ncbi:ADP-ribosylglycohydrolase family protein [Phaeodactylibacter xiamenensis]|uniref:ADP-ribosylglycohydrolase family protein n=1 Tax=Phaeodactylibacter xiamenensis TaxID=1524460 RepID=UPI0024A9837F|nr:ADP-ribosylglycohydrolase family protein [Phaeodactylibacter xiamenensis]